MKKLHEKSLYRRLSLIGILLTSCALLASFPSSAKDSASNIKPAEIDSKFFALTENRIPSYEWRPPYTVVNVDSLPAFQQKLKDEIEPFLQETDDGFLWPSPDEEGFILYSMLTDPLTVDPSQYSYDLSLWKKIGETPRIKYLLFKGDETKNGKESAPAQILPVLVHEKEDRLFTIEEIFDAYRKTGPQNQQRWQGSVFSDLVYQIMQAALIEDMNQAIKEDEHNCLTITKEFDLVSDLRRKLSWAKEAKLKGKDLNKSWTLEHIDACIPVMERMLAYSELFPEEFSLSELNAVHDFRQYAPHPNTDLYESNERYSKLIDTIDPDHGREIAKAKADYARAWEIALAIGNGLSVLNYEKALSADFPAAFKIDPPNPRIFRDRKAREEHEKLIRTIIADVKEGYRIEGRPKVKGDTNPQGGIIRRSFSRSNHPGWQENPFGGYYKDEIFTPADLLINPEKVNAHMQRNRFFGFAVRTYSENSLIFTETQFAKFYEERLKQVDKESEFFFKMQNLLPTFAIAPLMIAAPGASGLRESAMRGFRMSPLNTLGSAFYQTVRTGQTVVPKARDFTLGGLKMGTMFAYGGFVARTIAAIPKLQEGLTKTLGFFKGVLTDTDLSKMPMITEEFAGSTGMFIAGSSLARYDGADWGQSLVSGGRLFAYYKFGHLANRLGLAQIVPQPVRWGTVYLANAAVSAGGAVIEHKLGGFYDPLGFKATSTLDAALSGVYSSIGIDAGSVVDFAYTGFRWSYGNEAKQNIKPGNIIQFPRVAYVGDKTPPPGSSAEIIPISKMQVLAARKEETSQRKENVALAPVYDLPKDPRYPNAPKPEGGRAKIIGIIEPYKPPSDLPEEPMQLAAGAEKDFHVEGINRNETARASGNSDNSGRSADSNPPPKDNPDHKGQNKPTEDQGVNPNRTNNANPRAANGRPPRSDHDKQVPQSKASDRSVIRGRSYHSGSSKVSKKSSTRIPVIGHVVSWVKEIKNFITTKIQDPSDDRTHTLDQILRTTPPNIRSLQEALARIESLLRENLSGDYRGDIQNAEVGTVAALDQLMHEIGYENRGQLREHIESILEIENRGDPLSESVHRLLGGIDDPARLLVCTLPKGARLQHNGMPALALYKPDELWRKNSSPDNGERTSIIFLEGGMKDTLDLAASFSHEVSHFDTNSLIIRWLSANNILESGSKETDIYFRNYVEIQTGSWHIDDGFLNILHESIAYYSKYLAYRKMLENQGRSESYENNYLRTKLSELENKFLNYLELKNIKLEDYGFDRNDPFRKGLEIWATMHETIEKQMSQGLLPAEPKIKNRLIARASNGKLTTGRDLPLADILEVLTGNSAFEESGKSHVFETLKFIFGREINPDEVDRLKKIARAWIYSQYHELPEVRAGNLTPGELDRWIDSQKAIWGSSLPVVPFSNNQLKLIRINDGRFLFIKDSMNRFRTYPGVQTTEPSQYSRWDPSYWYQKITGAFSATKKRSRIARPQGFSSEETERLVRANSNADPMKVQVGKLNDIDELLSKSGWSREGKVSVSDELELVILRPQPHDYTALVGNMLVSTRNDMERFTVCVIPKGNSLDIENNGLDKFSDHKIISFKSDEIAEHLGSEWSGKHLEKSINSSHAMLLDSSSSTLETTGSIFYHGARITNRYILSKWIKSNLLLMSHGYKADPLFKRFVRPGKDGTAIVDETFFAVFQESLSLSARARITNPLGLKDSHIMELKKELMNKINALDPDQTALEFLGVTENHVFKAGESIYERMIATIADARFLQTQRGVMPRNHVMEMLRSEGNHSYERQSFPTELIIDLVTGPAAKNDIGPILDYLYRSNVPSDLVSNFYSAARQWIFLQYPDLVFEKSIDTAHTDFNIWKNEKLERWGETLELVPFEEGFLRPSPDDPKPINTDPGVPSLENDKSALIPNPELEIPRELFDKARKAQGTDEDILIIQPTNHEDGGDTQLKRRSWWDPRKLDVKGATRKLRKKVNTAMSRLRENVASTLSLREPVHPSGDDVLMKFLKNEPTGDLDTGYFEDRIKSDRRFRLRMIDLVFHKAAEGEFKFEREDIESFTKLNKLFADGIRHSPGSEYIAGGEHRIDLVGQAEDAYNEAIKLCDEIIKSGKRILFAIAVENRERALQNKRIAKEKWRQASDNHDDFNPRKRMDLIGALLSNGPPRKPSIYSMPVTIERPIDPKDEPNSLRTIIGNLKEKTEAALQRQASLNQFFSTAKARQINLLASSLASLSNALATIPTTAKLFIHSFDKETSRLSPDERDATIFFKTFLGESYEVLVDFLIFWKNEGGYPFERLATDLLSIESGESARPMFDAAITAIGIIDFELKPGFLVFDELATKFNENYTLFRATDDYRTLDEESNAIIACALIRIGKQEEALEFLDLYPVSKPELLGNILFYMNEAGMRDESN